MTATVISFRSGHTVTPGHVAVLAEILTRDGGKCAHCRAPGGAAVLYGYLGPREVYVVLDSLEAFDAATGEAMGTVPADTIPATSGGAGGDQTWSCCASTARGGTTTTRYPGVGRDDTKKAGQGEPDRRSLNPWKSPPLWRRRRLSATQSCQCLAGAGSVSGRSLNSPLIYPS